MKRFKLVSLSIMALASIALAFSGGDGSQANPYQVANTNDLQEIATNNPNSGDYFVLTSSITGVDFVIGGSFNGNFDGDGNTIDVSYQGTLTGDDALFEEIGQQGVVKNLNVNLDYDLSAYSGNWEFVAGIAGFNNGGTIENCSAAGSIDAQDKGLAVGGIVASNAGTLQNCQSEVSIATDYGCNAGGIAGQSTGSIDECSFMGSMDVADSGFASIDDSENPTIAGGIVGYAYNGSEYTNLSVNAEIIADASGVVAGGVVGYLESSAVTGAEMAGGSVTVPSAPFNGSIVGGIVGQSLNSSVQQAVLAEQASVIGGRYSDTGGIVGYSGISTAGESAEISEAASLGYVETGYLGYAGGVAGRNSSGMVMNCYAAGNVVANETNGDNTVLGGVVGLNETDDQNGGEAPVQYVHYAGTIMDKQGGEGYLGAVIGWNNGGSLDSAHYDSDLAGVSEFIGWGDQNETNSTALNSTQMAQQSNFPNFNFAQIWSMGAAYPVLTFQIGGASMTYNLDQGYNWISFPVLPDDDSLENVLADYSNIAQDFDSIVSAAGETAQYYQGTWYGTLDIIEPGKMYILNSGAGGSFDVTGFPVDPETEITLVSGWNWIGSTLQDPISLDDAFQNAQLSDFDTIVAPSGQTAQYYQGQWYGTLQSLVPGVGYKLNVATAQSFFFDGALAPASQSEPELSEQLPAGAPDWTSPTGLKNKMTITAYVVDENEQQIAVADGSLLSAWTPGGEIAGVSDVTDGPTKRIFPLVVFSDESTVSGMTLKVYDAAEDEIYDIQGTFEFISDETVGNIFTPVEKQIAAEAATYTVTFDAGDHGTITAGDEVQEVEEGDSATAPTIEADEGWEFAGWDTAFDNVTSDLTVTATYTAIPQYTVTFDPGANGTITSGDAVQTVYEGEDADAPTVTANAGWEFTGWDTDFTNVTSDITVTAEYTEEIYTVTFMPGANGTITSGDTEQTVAYGGAATAPTVEADEGWEFAGWDTAFDNVTSDLTVTATYTAIPQYTVTFDPGANGTITSGDTEQTVAYGGAAIAPTVEADAGWEFAGWDTAFDNVTSDLTVTATYTEIPQYTVTFDSGANGSITAGDSVQTVYEGEDAAEPTIEANEGWEFTGWDVAFDNVTSDLTVTATYTEIPQYTVTFDSGANGSITAGDSVQTVYEGEDAAEPTIEANEGWEFTGWDVAFDNVTSDLTVTATYTEIPQYTVTFDSGANGSITAGDSVQTVYEGEDAAEPTIEANEGWEFTGWDVAFDNVTSDLTVTAQYEQITYTVTFMPGANGTITSGDAVQTVYEGEDAAEPTIEANEGWEFAGWDVAFDNVTSDLTVTAIYSELPDIYTVNFYAGDYGEILSGASQQVDEGEAAELPTLVPDFQYRFEGWYNNDTRYSLAALQNVTENMELTAAYSLQPEPEPADADFNGDKYVGTDDLAILMESYLTAEGSLASDTAAALFAGDQYGDIDSNQWVDNGDFYLFSNNWLKSFEESFTYNLVQGYNWISFPVLPEDKSLANVMEGYEQIVEDFDSITASNGKTAQYFNGEWYGTIQNIVPTRMYVLYSANGGTFEVSGNEVGPEGVMNLYQGWNWLPFFQNQSMPIADAFQHLDVQDLDQIIAPNGEVAQYYGNQWYGTLDTLEPGVGYKFNVSKAQGFSYTHQVSPLEAMSIETAVNNKPNWSAPLGLSNQMKVYAKIVDENGDQIAASNGSELSAWTPDNPSTIAGATDKVILGPAGNHFQLVIFSDKNSVEDMSLKVYDADSDKIYNIVHTVDFQKDTELGNVVTFQVYSTDAGMPVNVPDWQNPTGLMNSMKVYAKVVDQNGDQIATANNSELSAWTPAGQIAGVTDEVVAGPTDDHFQLVVFSDETSVPGMGLKVYDAAADQVYEIIQRPDFEADTDLGNVLTLQVYTIGENAPDWQSPSGLQNQMQLYAKVTQGGVPIAQPDGSLLTAITPSGNIAGVAEVAANPSGTKYFPLTIFSDEDSFTGLIFKVYDAATDTVYDINETLDFQADAQIGNVTSLEELTVSGEQADSYTVNFWGGANGTLQGDVDQTVDLGEDASEPLVIANQGWEFTGWDGSFENVISDRNITAQYTDVTYTVVFNPGANGQITSGDELQTVPSGGDAVEPAVSADAGYTFTGWDTDFTNVSSDLTVTAQYEVTGYTVDFLPGAHGSITAGDDSQIVQHGQAAAEPTVTPDAGWEFTGWDTAFDNVTSDLTVTAQYQTAEFTVTFMPGNKGLITAGQAVQTVEYGDAAAAPTVTPIVGWQFDGWDTAFDNVTSDLTVTAQYEEGPAEEDEDGTEKDPWIIDDPTDWQKIIDNPSDHFIVNGDVDFGTNPLTNPLTVPFSGHLYSETNATLSYQINAAGLDYVGLFAVVSDGALIEYLNFNVDVTGRNVVGGIAGYFADSTIKDCSVSGIVDGDKFVGSFVGENRGLITGCSSDAGLGIGEVVGWAIGTNRGTVDNCVFSGTYEGGSIGIVGSDPSGTVTDSQSTDDEF
ncbi:Internalin-A precursor [Sedimentisphaera cyanobacteriorum]|uniref:Internalin-A n=1 Tax=Sedimentisphaera cyanobacteriorum TaxID=1940790 RepID=A0A1Q2HQ37_9BACT|nr:InlB B-repeat-containing protein [Sedimentisphaera cyanobacteriorum]AQQ09365.1 Internalin-A precursor [Sedimentisphaera cyanobacteriorum]